MMMNDGRSHKVQLLRGLGIVAVVFLHNMRGGLMQVWLRPFVNFSVGLFLFLSGMLSSAESWHPQKRLSKVIIPYALWTLIYVVLFNYKTTAQIPKLFVAQLATGKAAAIMYYVFVYCELSLLVPVIDRLARSRVWWIGFVISPVEIVVMRMLPIVAGIEVSQTISTAMSLSCLGWFTYFYLGYMLGNGIKTVRCATSRLAALWAAAMALQVAEGCWYYRMGVENCGTQLKLTAVLSGALFCMLAYRFICSHATVKADALRELGDHSFGIYFSHLAVMFMLGKIPGYAQCVPFPVNALSAIAVSYVCVRVGRIVLGKYAKYLAL